jgi:predicted porin
MKKSLIALAVAGAFAAPAAMAEVTISGAINLGIEFAKSDEGAAALSGAAVGDTSGDLSRTLLNSNYSNINIASSDDIGNGNRIIFNYQLVVNTESTSGNPVNRNSYLGIAGTWGAFKMGTNENVYERHMYQADPLDGALGPGGNLMILGTPGANTAFEVGQAGCLVTGCAGFYRRTDQTIWYESPNWNGFTFEVDYTLEAFKTAEQASLPGVPSVSPQVLSAGVKWAPEGIPFYVDFAIERHEDMFGLAKIESVHSGVGITTGASGSTDDAWQVGVGYTFGPATIHARYETINYELEGGSVTFAAPALAGVTELERVAYWLGLKWNLPTGYVGAEIGMADEWDTNVGDGVDTGATMMGVGYFHNLSKQSQLQFIYARTDNDDNASYTQAGAGLGGPGRDHQVMHVGIKHTF